MHAKPWEGFLVSLEEFEIRVNHNLEPRRPNKIYKDGSKNLNGHTKCV
jgi:hypothetical protein